jgi:ketosteroid isomerase-like protein
MAGSRAASAREPGQIREEAALSDTARAPRSSLAGAEDRRARPGPGFEEGCTVRLFQAMTDNVHATIVRELIERWNAGDTEGVVELYSQDTVMYAGEEWPDQTVYRGHDGVRENIEQWRSVWESSSIELEKLESHGERLVASGAWITRGRASGVSGSMPFVILLRIRNGKIASLEWFTDHNVAVAAARDAGSRSP